MEPWTRTKFLDCKDVNKIVSVCSLCILYSILSAIFDYLDSIKVPLHISLIIFFSRLVDIIKRLFLGHIFINICTYSFLIIYFTGMAAIAPRHFFPAQPLKPHPALQSEIWSTGKSRFATVVWRINACLSMKRILAVWLYLRVMKMFCFPGFKYSLRVKMAPISSKGATSVFLERWFLFFSPWCAK